VTKLQTRQSLGDPQWLDAEDYFVNMLDLGTLPAISFPIIARHLSIIAPDFAGLTIEMGKSLKVFPSLEHPRQLVFCLDNSNSIRKRLSAFQKKLSFLTSLQHRCNSSTDDRWTKSFSSFLDKLEKDHSFVPETYLFPRVPLPQILIGASLSLSSLFLTVRCLV